MGSTRHHLKILGPYSRSSSRFGLFPNTISYFQNLFPERLEMKQFYFQPSRSLLLYCSSAQCFPTEQFSLQLIFFYALLDAAARIQLPCSAFCLKILSRSTDLVDVFFCLSSYHKKHFCQLLPSLTTQCVLSQSSSNSVFTASPALLFAVFQPLSLAPTIQTHSH